MFASTIARRMMFAAICAAVMTPLAGHAQKGEELQLTYSDGQFQPGELRAPAGKPLTLRVKNQTAKSMEFESHALKVEKVITARGEAVVNIRAQKPGRYEFFDEFNEKARGTLVVE